MNFYTLHQSGLTSRKTLAIKEGFNWPAFLFFPIWAIYNRLWLVAVVFICITTLLGWFVASFLGGEFFGAAVFFGLQLALGWTANDIRRFYLLTRGFRERTVLVAENKESAVFRYTSSFQKNIGSENKNRAGGPW